MKRLFILFVFTFLMMAIGFRAFLKLKQPDSLDAMISISEKVLTLVDTETLYFFCNNTSVEMSFDRQFSLAPKVISIEEYEAIPRHGFIVLLNDKTVDDVFAPNTELISGTDSIYSDQNEYYEIALLKKKL